jgi:hypothetical protein
VDSGGSTDRGGKGAAQIEQRNGFAKRKDDEPWSVADSVNSSSALEDLGGTRINIRRAIKDSSALLGRGIARVWPVVIPSTEVKKTPKTPLKIGVCTSTDVHT